jgi:hypothetical protein
MAADTQLTKLTADATRRAPDAPDLDAVIEDAGRERLAAYYLYTAVIAGVIDDHELDPEQWPAKLAEPMKRLVLSALAPRTERGLDAELTPSEQATRRSPGRQLEFAQLTVDLINQGAFGPICGAADSVRLAKDGDGSDAELEMLAGDNVVGRCKVADHWELVAQQLASAPHGDDPLADRASAQTFARKVARQLGDTGLSHGVSSATTLAVGFFPLGTAVGVGTRLVRQRIRTGRNEADALRRLGSVLRTLHAQADGELKAQTARRLRVSPASFRPR